MLTTLHIKNFTIISEVLIELKPNFTVITGETGAGKSIILDALNLVMGGRSEFQQIRPGAAQAEITAVFCLQNNKRIYEFMDTQGISFDTDEIIITRTLSIDKKSRILLNARPVPLQLIKQLSSILINIHSQHEHYALIKPEYQLQLLDQYAAHQELLILSNKHYKTWYDACTNYKKACTQADLLPEKQAIIEHYIHELSSLSLNQHSFNSLQQLHDQQQHVQECKDICQHSLQSLTQKSNHGILPSLYKLQIQLSNFTKVYPQIQKLSETLNQAIISLDEFTHELNQFEQSIQPNPEEKQRIDEQLKLINELARKHKASPDMLYEVLEQLENELSAMQQALASKNDLQAVVNQAQQAYAKHAQALRKSREIAAKNLSIAISKSMPNLGMPHAKIEIAFTYHDLLKPRSNGSEDISIMISTNPGQPLQSLQNVASGGELSRLSLIMQTLINQSNKKMLIFDEIDVGISGSTAAVVGQLLRQLGLKQQVLCITHLAQVAAQGHDHLLISKQAKADQTYAEVAALTNKTRVNEVARLLAGINITPETIANAKHLFPEETVTAD